MIEGARRVTYECVNCREPVGVNVLGAEKVGKVKLACGFCGFLGSYYGEGEKNGK